MKPRLAVRHYSNLSSDEQRDPPQSRPETLIYTILNGGTCVLREREMNGALLHVGYCVLL